MSQVICISNQKGGVGKTTTAINLSAALAAGEQRTLLVDFDPQGHATAGLGVEKVRMANSVYHGIIGKASPQEILVRTELDHLFLLPARRELFRAEAELMSSRGKEKVLRGFLMNIRNEFDYVIIDSAPSLNLLTLNAFLAADSLMIPLQCDFFALESLESLLTSLEVVTQRMHPDLRIMGILLTMFDAKDGVSNQIEASARRQFGDLVFKTVIPHDSMIKKTAILGRPLIMHSINAAAARRYLRLAEEVMTREEQFV
jgi:chromosome partitioning protein